MEAEFVNLRLARKRRLRASTAKQAAENRLLHGRPGAEKSLTAFERQRTETEFAGHRRERSEGDAASPASPDAFGKSS